MKPILVLVKAAQDVKGEEGAQVFEGCCFGNSIPLRTVNFVWHLKLGKRKVFIICTMDIGLSGLFGHIKAHC